MQDPDSRAPDEAARRPDIQGLRALAVLMVVIFHARLPMPGGFTGVDVFFVISGFVITAMLAREWQAEGRIRLRRFYARRYMRLTPALALTVAVVTLASLVMQSPFGPQQGTAATGIGALLLAANLVIARAAGDYFAEDANANPLLHTWSLSVEEQFYLVLPALLLGAWRLGRALGLTTAVPVAALATLSALSFLLSVSWVDGAYMANWLTAPFGGPEAFAFYGLPSRAWELGAGCLLAFWVTGGYSPTRSTAHTAGIIGIGLIALSAFTIDEAARFPGMLALIPVAGTALVILAGSGSGSAVNRVLSAKPLVVIGDWSYSIYLWHWPLIVFAEIAWPENRSALVLAAFGSMLPAWLSYHYCEQPLRGLRTATAAGTIGVVLATSATPVMLAVGLMAAAHTGLGGLFETPVAADEATLAGRAERNGVLSGARQKITRTTTRRELRSAHVVVGAGGCINTDVDPVGCRFGLKDAKGTLLLLGDSQAYALADGVIDAASALGYDVIVSSHTGCPFLGRDSSGRNQIECPRWQGHALDFALEYRPGAVVIANRSAAYVHPDRGWRTMVRDDGERAETVEEAKAIWRLGLEEVVEPLRDAGIPVVIFASVAEMPKFHDQRTLFAQGFGSVAYHVALDQVVADRQPAYDAELAVAELHPRATVFDPLPALCTDVCPSAVDGTVLYQDATHLSVDGSLRLSPSLRRSLLEVLDVSTASR